MTTVRAFLKHNFISKPKQAEAYTASAHARYVMRKGAASAIYSEHMPRQYHAVQRFLNQHEDGLRKNGRVIDKLIISIPHDVSEADAIKALRHFGHRIGHQRAPFLFALHGFDTRNHHAHFLFIDRDIETGKRVFGTTERNSTHGLKIEWQDGANEVFAQLGYEVRIQVHDGVELEADNDNSLPSEQLPEGIKTEFEAAPEQVEEPLAEDVGYDESDMEATLEREPDSSVSLAANRARLLASTVTELNRFHDAAQRIKDAEERYAALTQRAEAAKIEADKYAEDSMPILHAAHQAQERLHAFTNPNGKLKGVSVNILGFTLRSSKRKNAEEAAITAQSRGADAAFVEHTKKEYRNHIQTLAVEAQAAAQEAFMARNYLRSAYGNEKELEAAEANFKRTIAKTMKGLDPAEVEEAFLSLEITPEEYKAYLVELGDKARLEEFLENEPLYEIREVDGPDL